MGYPSKDQKKMPQQANVPQHGHMTPHDQKGHQSVSPGQHGQMPFEMQGMAPQQQMAPYGMMPQQMAPQQGFMHPHCMSHGHHHGMGPHHHGHMPYMDQSNHYMHKDHGKKLDSGSHKKEMHSMCKKYHLYFVQCEMTDGNLVEGIIDEFDDDGVTLLTPCGDMDRDDERQFWPGGFYGGYGYGYGHRYPRHFRRFRRQRYPFINISRLFFPFFF